MNLEEIIKEIKESFEDYLKRRKEEKNPVQSVAKYFNIPIDDTREKDYIITNIDFNIPWIKILDTQTNTFYVASYTRNIDMLNYYGDINLNRVVSVSPLRKEESLYYIGETKPIVKRMTFTSGDYELVVEDATPVRGTSLDNENAKSVTYWQNLQGKNSCNKQILFSKIHTTFPNKNEILDQLYTGPFQFIKCDGQIERYTFTLDDRVIYGITEVKRKGLCDNLRGICLEKTSGDIARYFPITMNATDFPLIQDNNVVSAMLFRIYTEDDREYLMQIYKTKEDIKVLYQGKKHYYGKKYHVNDLETKEYFLPNIFPEAITSGEISNILIFLQDKLDSAILEPIARELTSFSRKIDERKGLTEEEVDPLSHKAFDGLSFDEICELINANKDYYFTLAKKQFLSLTSPKRTRSKDDKRIRKPHEEQ